MQKTTIYRKPMGENLFEEEFTIEALSQMGDRRCPTSTIRASLATAWARRWNRHQGASTPPRSNDCWTTFDRI